MARLGIVGVVVIFLVVTCAALGQEEKAGIRKKLQVVEETTERANTELGYVIGIAVFTPVIFAAALTWNILSAPLSAVNDTWDAVTTVYKNLRGEQAETAVEPVEEQGE